MEKEIWLQKIELLHPESIKLGLDRIFQVARQLDIQHFSCPVVTVGGTNGKGSCVKFLESILQAEGYRVGAYTSPHLLSFNERIRINNQEVTDSDLVQAFEVIDKARADIALTFFEFTTLAALWLFKQSFLDAVILEVGLGGRLDAVNIVNPDIAMITSIDLDHTEWLGTTRAEIAKEKAGIFRQQGVAICADPAPPDTLILEAQRLNCRLYRINQDFAFSESALHWSFHSESTDISELPYPGLSLTNAATALMAIQLLTKLPVANTAIRNGLISAHLLGRFQVIEQPIPCILDVAHNPASAQMLANNLSKEPSQNYVVVIGMLKDKDIANTIKPVAPFIKRSYLGTLQTTRGASAADLLSHIQAFINDECYTYGGIREAFEAAASSLAAGEKILVFGSFYTVSEVLYTLRRKSTMVM